MGFALWLGVSSRGNGSDDGHGTRPFRPRLVPASTVSAALPPVSADLADLTARIQRGDHAAFTTFVNEYYDRATRVAYAVVQSLDVAQDIAQDVFIRLWERRETLDALRLSPAYVLTAAHHRALDVLKHEDIRARHRETAGLASVAATPSGEDVILDHTTVETALSALPERWQLALRLRLQEHVDVPTLAAALGVSPNAAHQLLYRAIRELRRRLGAP